MWPRPHPRRCPRPPFLSKYNVVCWVDTEADIPCVAISRQSDGPQHI